MNWVICFLSLLMVSASGFGQTFEDEEEMEKSMMDKTKKAIMSYEIVEQRTNEIVERIQASVFGQYAHTLAIFAPLATGKLSFSYKKLKFNYSHFSEKAEVDLELSEKWELFLDHYRTSEGAADKSGVKYSYRF